MVCLYFHLIEDDDLALEIDEKLKEYQDFHDELIPTVGEYREAIIKDTLSRSNGNFKHPRTLVSLWKYRNAHE